MYVCYRGERKRISRFSCEASGREIAAALFPASRVALSEAALQSYGHGAAVVIEGGGGEDGSYRSEANSVYVCVGRIRDLLPGPVPR